MKILTFKFSFHGILCHLFIKYFPALSFVYNVKRQFWIRREKGRLESENNVRYHISNAILVNLILFPVLLKLGLLWNIPCKLL